MGITRSGSLADRVFERLEDDILNGTSRPGDIWTEIALSERLQVSRTPIREAIRRLQQENLVRESGKGVLVVGVSRRDLEDIYEIRGRIEGLAARRCAAIITDDQLAELESILDLQEFYTAKGNPDRIQSTDTEFHKKIYEFCGSEIYGSMLSELHRKVCRFRRRSVENAERAKTAGREHREILEALRAHDGDRADQLAVTHIQNAKNNILKHWNMED